MPLNFTLAARNLFHDRVRFIATMIGIVFSVVLVMVQMGLYLGFGRMVTTMIDHADTDLWIMRKGTKCFEDPSLLGAKRQSDYQSVPGVASADPIVIGFSDWRLSSGEMTPVFLVGSDLSKPDLRPWKVIAGSVQDLLQPGTVAIDKAYFERLGLSGQGVGEEADIRGKEVKVAAVTQGIRSFTTTPYVFTGINQARDYIGIPSSFVSYYLVHLRPGADVKQVQSALQQQSDAIEVLTSAQFQKRSRDFWLFGTGAGAALFAGALLGVIVGTVIVAQTLYSSTKDHLDEFATLRAMGSSNRYLYTVIIYQALVNAVVGFCLASIVGFGVVLYTTNGALPVVITPALMGGVLLLTVLMCIGSALTAIVKVVRIDPAMVFTR
jgi:putative ABC transport system permease protein